MSIVATTDFKDEYKISKQCDVTGLQAYIDRYEKYYLVRLLGADLYDLFIADLSVGTPQAPLSAIYLSIFNAFETDDGNCLNISEGIRVMLKQFIYFHFTRDQVTKTTIVGKAKPKMALADNTGFTGYNLIDSYNKGIDNYREIQNFICDNSTDYPTENMQPIQYISGI